MSSELDLIYTADVHCRKSLAVITLDLISYLIETSHAVKSR